MNKTVYSVHKFVAENVDEISFNVGEKIMILEKDEGYNDGWWKGRNEKGEIGLFPISYTVSTPPLEHDSRKMRPSSTATIDNSNKHMSLSSKNITSLVKQSLSNNPILKSKPIEEWSSKQVAVWLTSIGFDQAVADDFQDQEITGDILLELTLDSLKELQIDTFGKRFKIHSAINVLKNESKEKHESQLNRKQSMTYYNTFHDDDDASSTYTKASFINEQRISLNSTIPQQQQQQQRMPIVRKTSQMSTNSTFRWHQEKTTNNERRHTLNTNHLQQENHSKYNFMRSSLFPANNKLQSILPSSNMTRRSEDVPLTQTSMIPDMEGWLYKQGDRYKNWNKRWFVLKGVNLFYFKSPKAVQMKGIINLKGYRVEPDSSIQTGKYCFKLQHEKERTFYFYTDQEKYMKDWVKTIMKATIERDYGTPVMSSSTIPTISLDTARRIQPRPPSTLFDEQRRQRNRSSSISGSYRSHDGNFGLAPMEEHPEEHVFQQSLSSPITGSSRAPSIMSQRTRTMDPDYAFDARRMRLKDSGFTSSSLGHPSRSLTQSSGSSSATTNTSLKTNYMTRSPAAAPTYYPDEEDEDLIDPENISVIESKRPNASRRPSEIDSESVHDSPSREFVAKRKTYLDWLNRHIQYKVQNLSELSTGEVLLELLESLSHKEIRRYPINHSQSVYSQMMDRMITAFEHMHQEGVPLAGGYTFRDILNGHEVKIMALLDDIRAWYGQSRQEQTEI
ncbi:hypothetical protein G6F46_007109 [Rhizopus delemar]|nr:hypothetical protein G6F55_005767 [Rhizopus delemar]KAG1542321.1 hypothetical protein G6F51_007345 [Rhizopus arrhizus]KAG1524573.1 hypothetical protein G6F52_004078 [Rhizopus delemar]KAG1557030.1 hypothetical protein G6F49_005766 [Rhizopus delemar]KAG1568908.1 hypothetical protein G6F50_006867 [Rhizopus delemar]